MTENGFKCYSHLKYKGKNAPLVKLTKGDDGRTFIEIHYGKYLAMTMSPTDNPEELDAIIQSVITSVDEMSGMSTIWANIIGFLTLIVTVAWIMNG